MGLPKWNTTKSKRNKRRMHLFIKPSTPTACPKCGKPVLPHKACLNCGYYRGIDVLDVLKKLTKKEKKTRQKEITAKEAEEKAGGEKKPLSWEGLSKK